VIQNLVEEHVRESYDAVRRRFPEFCGCHVCREDVYVLALNRLPARYVTTRAGKVVTAVKLVTDQERTQIDVAVIDGIRTVDRSPRCGRAPSSG
jgi:competence protein ComFB